MEKTNSYPFTGSIPFFSRKKKKKKDLEPD